MSMSKAGGTSITIKGFAFSVPASVTAGAEVSVTTNDAVAHTVTLKTAKLDVKVAASGKATFTAPKSPGRYPITCDYHPTMQGSLVVK